MNVKDENMAAHDARRLAAAEWVVRLHSTQAGEDAVDQWLAWCQANPDNLEIFEEVRDLWSALEHPVLKPELVTDLQERSAVDPSAWPDDEAIEPPQPAAMTATQSWLSPRFRLGFWSSMRTRISAVRASIARDHGFGVVTVAIALIALAIVVLQGRQDFTQTLTTAVASLSRQTLPDGSVVELGAQSRIRVSMSREKRTIYVDGGEAFFRVAKDAKRPFTVYAGDVNVVALGTQFNVRKARDSIVVTVAEGTVSVASDTDMPEPAGIAPARSRIAPPAARVEAGRRVSYSSTDRSMIVTRFHAASPNVSGWSVGNLQFINEPLASVIADVNRYSLKKIALGDEALGNRTFTGTLRRDAIDDWLKGVRDVFEIDILDDGENGIVLATRPQK